jgi:hypothetical protein
VQIKAVDRGGTMVTINIKRDGNGKNEGKN